MSTQIPLYICYACKGSMQVFSEPYGLDKAKRYEIIRTIGRGAFGEVNSACFAAFSRNF